MSKHARQITRYRAISLATAIKEDDAIDLGPCLAWAGRSVCTMCARCEEAFQISSQLRAPQFCPEAPILTFIDQNWPSDCTVSGNIQFAVLTIFPPHWSCSNKFDFDFHCSKLVVILHGTGQPHDVPRQIRLCCRPFSS